MRIYISLLNKTDGLFQPLHFLKIVVSTYFDINYELKYYTICSCGA